MWGSDAYKALSLLDGFRQPTGPPVESRGARTILDPAAIPRGYEQRSSGIYAPTSDFGDLLNRAFYRHWGVGRFDSIPLEDPLSSEEIARQQEEARLRESERQAVRKAADERAQGLLRAAGAEGEMLADGDGVVIPSKRFPHLTYGIAPVEDGKVLVFDSRIGSVGDICIQSERDAPTADVLLTRLKLCQSDEEKLWRIGNFDGTEYDIEYFLPKQIRVWMKGNGE